MSFEIERRRIYSSGTIFRMAVPLMLSFLLEQLIGMTDVAFLGRVGESGARRRKRSRASSSSCS